MSSQKMACFKCKYFCVTGTGTIQKAAGLFSLPCLAPAPTPSRVGGGRKARPLFFKTRRMPSLEVFRASGHPCLRFEKEN